MKLSKFSRFIIRNSVAIILVGSLLTLLGAYYSIKIYKNLKTDIEELLPSQARSGKDLGILSQRLESIDFIAIIALSKDVPKAKQFIEDLAIKLKVIPKDIASSIEYRIDDEMRFFKDRAPLFVDLPDLQDLNNYIRERVKYEKEMYNPVNIFPVGDHTKKPVLDLDALRKKYQGNYKDGQYPDGYYATQDGTARVIMVYMAGKHSNIEKAKELSGWVTRLVGDLNPKSYAPDLEVRYGGGVQSFLEEHEALVKDLTVSTIIVVVLVTLLMFWFYRDVAGTTALIASLFMGTFCTFGIAYFAVGYLNANSAFLGSIVIGNGINFGIIFLARYIEEQRAGKGLYRSIDKGLRITATATWTAALAAGLSYGSLMLTRFRGFRQFGVIGLIGMILCWVTAFTLLPAFLSLARFKKKKKIYNTSHAEGAISNFLASFVSKYAKEICIASAVFSVAALLTFPRISSKIIQTDLTKLRNKQSMISGASYLDKYLFAIFQHYLAETAILADSREEANQVAERLRARMKEEPKTDIAVVKTFDDFIPKQQEQKIPIIREIKAQLTPEIVKRLAPQERTWVKEFLSDEALKPLREQDLPALVKMKFTEKSGEVGRFVVVEPPLDPKNDLAWDGVRLIAFISEVRKIVDSVRPGIPVAGQLPISADMVESISYDGPTATAFAFIAVVLLVLVLFRDLKTVSRVLFALFLGVLWLFGLMLGFDLKINFLNFIALPITFGIGVDYGVNVFQRYRLEGSGKILSVIRNAGGAVTMASLTTVIGYSSLIIAENQAFVSFGTLAVLGEITTLIAAIVSLPAYLVWKGKKKDKPVHDLSLDSSELIASGESINNTSLSAKADRD